MNVLILTSSEHTKELFIEHLIPAGHAVYHTEFEWDVVNQMILHEIDFVIIDLEHQEFESSLHLVEEIKNHSDERIRKGICILYRHDIEKKQVSRFLRAGVAGYLSADVDLENLAGVIEQRWEALRGLPPERKFARATLNRQLSEERVEVLLPIEDRILPLKAFATDISAGGIAIEIVDMPNLAEIQVGDKIHQLKFELEGHVCEADAVVVAVHKPFLALRFTAMSEEDLHELSHFVFLRLSHFI